MDFVQLLNMVGPEQWELIGETVISALLLSPFMAGVKKWFEVRRELMMTLYVIGGSMITAGIAYLHSNPQLAPWLMIPAQGSAVFVLSQVVYYALVKPARKRWSAALIEAQKINEAKRAAAVGAEGLPSTNFQ